MNRRIVDRVESWESRSIQGGISGLQSLVDENFSGAVSAAGTWLFMLNGRGVGVFDGSLEDFSGSEVLAYEAPDPSLPLLFAMQETGGETYATYYTNDTPLSEVDNTLTDANFTGYIELSENVLSGDYFTVYYGGRSMSAAFVGSSERLITGDEAYEKAAGEVGIYEVTKVDLDLVEIPDSETAGSTESSSAAAAFDEPALDAHESTADDSDTMDSDESPIEEAEASGGPDPSDMGVDPIGKAGDATTAGSDEDTGGVEAGGLADTIEAAETASSGRPTESIEDGSEGQNQTQAHAHADSEPVEDSGTEQETPDTASVEQPDQTDAVNATESRSDSAPSTPDDAHTTGAEPSSQSREQPTASDQSPSEAADDPFSEEEQWRETRTIPALNPEESESPTGSSSEQADQGRADHPGSSPSPSADVQHTSQRSADHSRPDTESPSPDQASPSGTQSPDQSYQLDELKSALEEREQEIGTLRNRHEEATAEIETLREERDDLRSRIEELEKAVAGADSGGVDAGPSQSLDRQTALEQTDLFVRYGSKGEGTLEKAHAGQATREEVAENLRLEHHTRFEEDDVAVGGRPFTAFLGDTIEYRFIEWLVEDLLWEIQGTGSRGKLKALYDALPAIDRAEFRGVVTTRDDEGEERRQEFDVIVRDRMGQPLVVANINDRRDPATGEMMEDLVEASTDVAEELDTLGAAFQVTASFFKPDALETASGATGSGLLSRDKRESFVKLSRKRGYHLCLVESRGDDFHVTVPEL